MRTCYKIYTEDKNWLDVQDIVSSFFDGATILYGTGLWEGKEEDSTVIEIICEDNQSNGIQIRSVCDQIKQLNKQHEVWYTKHMVQLEKV